MGHLFRMLVLSQHLRERGASIVFIIRENEIAQTVLQERKQVFMHYPPECSESEIIRQSLQSLSPLPCAWIFDVLDTESEWIRILHDYGLKVICFDDTRGGLTEADQVINAIVHCWGVYSSSGMRVPVIEGPSCAIIAPTARARSRRRIVPENVPLRLGISMGGSDTHGMTVYVIEALAVSGISNITCDICAGPHFLHYDPLEAACERAPFPTAIHRFVPDLHEKLDNTDVVVCGGGITLFEVCAMGLPALAFANEPHEEKTIADFEKKGLCRFLGSVRCLDSAQTAAQLRSVFEDPGGLSETASRAYEYFAVEGAETCAHTIQQVMNGACVLNGR
jgi:spore coat polysaccharide biosynthesis predicted glycosyltransferase SpsG